MLYTKMGSEMTPSLILRGASEAPPMGVTESDTPWEVGLKNWRLTYLLGCSNVNDSSVFFLVLVLVLVQHVV